MKSVHPTLTSHKFKDIENKTKCRWAIICLFLYLFSLLSACITLPNANDQSLLASTPSLPSVDHTPTEKALSITNVPPTKNAAPIFAEEFSGMELDTTIWATEYRWGPTNKPELQYYSPDALEVRNGILRIKAEKRQMDGMEYTSGVIASFDRFTFTYGYVEMRAKVPAGKGLWPAFWLHLNNDDKTGEIDVFEFLGHEPHIIHMTLHFPDIDGDSVDDGSWFNGPDFSKGYHIYAVNWEPDRIIWYVDGIQRFHLVHDIPNEPMYILANLAVGGDWPGNPNETTHFPAYYDIDYIRVYNR